MQNKIFRILAGIFAFLILSCFFALPKAVSAQVQNADMKFAKAAEANDKLQYSLKWNFGRKPQKGWYLYVPLIKHALQTESKAETADFAEKIYEWQKENKLKPNGILNRDTLFSFIKYWQSKRIRPVYLAKNEDLLTADISNFYDPTRDIELLKVEKKTFVAYKKMISAAMADESLKLNIDEEGNLSEDELFLKLILFH